METKECNVCFTIKPLDCFNKKCNSSDGLDNRCKECNKAKNREWYSKNKSYKIKESVRQKSEHRQKLAERISEIKANGSCKFCGEDTPICLDFHHESDKEFEISTAKSLGLSWTKISEEISKCILVCANCHRKIHAGLIDL